MHIASPTATLIRRTRRRICLSVGPRKRRRTLFALMFYSPLVADQLKNRRKTVTIRLGDKTGKYKKGMVAPVLVGQRFGPREHIFDAVIDKVEVKPLGDVSPREIQHEN